ncbi:hypothetical protein GCT13_13385 [Paraburkholderia sp. CNPSo 3157]|uniref:DUF2188 domain-containing protein n=1 Tax=Paraburkholderia franconis TaxID=2654983 RepID=A0A7X1NAF4_9BURK|nr:hypothetical protein [Paraburkholderia franconis]MPW17903.1 hypothetical protein [Paraburkholderia franconis]
MSATGKAFWLVWSPSGVTPPKYRDESRESAIAEAERLARERVGAEFYVLAATDLRAVDRMVRTQLLSIDDRDIPF